jgi:hypothetical protein
LGPSEPTTIDLTPSGELRTGSIGDNLDTARPPDQDDQQDPFGDFSGHPPVLPSGDIKDIWLQDDIRLDDLKLTTDFVKHLQQATLDDPDLGLSDEVLNCLCNPLHMAPSDAVDEITLMAIDLYMINPSEETYEAHCVFVLKHFGTDLPSYYKVN